MTDNKHLATFLYILQAVIFFGTGFLITRYEKTVTNVGDLFYPITVCMGVVVGIITLIILINTETNHSYLKEKPRPKTWGIILITALLCLTIVLVVAGIIVSITWHPGIPNYGAVTYLLGCVPAMGAVCILRYLPHILPQKEEDNRSI